VFSPRVRGVTGGGGGGSSGSSARSDDGDDGDGAADATCIVQGATENAEKRHITIVIDAAKSNVIVDLVVIVDTIIVVVAIVDIIVIIGGVGVGGGGDGVFARVPSLCGQHDHTHAH
jgi:hypothetical protein